MSDIANKVKEKLKGTKDKVTSTTKVGTSNTSSSNLRDRRSEEGAPGAEAGRKDDPLTQYRAKEAMTPAKEKEHEPTAVKREMTEKITEGGKRAEGTTAEEAREKARKSGMTKGTAGAEE